MVGFLLAAWCARGGFGPYILRGALIVLAATATGAALVMDSNLTVLVCFVSVHVFFFDMVWALLHATTSSAFDPHCRASVLSITVGFARTAFAAAQLISGSLLMHDESSAFDFWAAGWV